jgi:hypothetical protein
VISLALLPGPLTARQAPAVPDLLKAAGDYLTHYSQQLGAVAAEEDYMQYETSSGQMSVPKRVITDYVWIGRGDGGLYGFRDVTAIDRAPVRAHDDRLLALFKEPRPASLDSARELTKDSIRHYMDVNFHALDEPTIALEYLVPDNQARSAFKLEDVKKMNGTPVAVLKFTEQKTPRLVPTPEDSPAVGRAWIEVDSGVVRQTQLGLGGKLSNVQVTVKYARDKGLGLWLPVDMFQQSTISGAGSSVASNMGRDGGYNARKSLEGRATYSKFRQIPVDLAKLLR